MKKIFKFFLIVILSFFAILSMILLFDKINNKNKDFCYTVNLKKIENNKYIHFSLDDVYSIFSDLTVNKDKYSSIFDNDILLYLKKLHEKYGIVVSLYVFYEYGGSNLSNITSKYSEEFKENSDWLKFGFHAMSVEEPELISYKIAINNYELIINQLIRITNCVDCIDRVPRLHYYFGNIESVLGFRDSYLGILGLLSADDSRNSYYFDEEESSNIKESNYYEDVKNHLIITSTDLRLENSIDVIDDINSIIAINKNNQILEVFTHEDKIFDDDIQKKLELILKYTKELNYKSDYFMNLIYKNKCN